MAEYISKNEAINAVKSLESSMPAKDNYAKGYDAALGRALIAIREVHTADVQPVDRWISVDDRLPEEIGYYLVIIGNDMLYSIDIAEYSESRWHKHDRVIYWQDLPDYPKTINGARMDGEYNE